MSRLGIVTGLIAELDIIATAVRDLPQAARPLLYCAGADAGHAREGALGLIEAGADGLVSFGMAGGLSPRLGPGALVLADTVRAPDGKSVTTSASWRQRLTALAGAAVPLAVGTILGVAHPVAAPRAKEGLFRETGALAVDLESHGVAAAAAEAGLPFIVIRALADPAWRPLPTAALAGLGPGGRRRPVAVLLGLLLRPGEIPDVVRLAGDSRAALASLRRVASLALPRFGLGA
ncbi:MAG: nucleoside phosphorylase [Alphaproteobacteria bacterium]